MRLPRTVDCRACPPRRLLRPPNTRFDPAVPRQFSHKPPRLLLFSQASPRPQLPYLYTSSPSLVNGQYQMLRLLSINATQREFIKETAKLSVKFSIMFWAMSTCVTVASMAFLSERQERAFPSPHEWSMYTRFRFRRGKWWEVPENNEDIGFPNWARLYAEYDIALHRLEHPGKDGAGVVENEEGSLLVPGVGKTGFDLTAKSEEWRQGYYEVLMGMARAAERMEGWVTDKKGDNVWAPEFIASPTNPRPKVPPPGMALPPDEDKQIAVTEPPETFYIKALTSKGLTTYQRLTAALGYADWLSFKKLPDSAEEMYRWALDIAIAGLPVDPSGVINTKTAVLSASAPKEAITPNLILATTTLGIHLASIGNVSAALPIFLSALRARRSADDAQIPLHEPKQDSSVLGTFLTLLSEPVYPPLPPSGDESLVRREEDLCEEAALENYIGEILFATATSDAKRQQGLKWVRDGVSTAAQAQTMGRVRHDTERVKKCQKCEEVGLEAWGKITTFLAADARQNRERATSGMLGSAWAKATGTHKLDAKVEELEGEEEGVTIRLSKLRDKMLKEEYDEMDKKYARTFAF